MYNKWSLTIKVFYYPCQLSLNRNSIVLPQSYHFVAENKSGASIQGNGIWIKAKRWKFDNEGTLVYEVSETEVYINSVGALGDQAFASGKTIDNDTDKFLGGDFMTFINAETTFSGTVNIYLEASTSEGTSFPHQDDAVSDLGDIVCVVPVLPNSDVQKHFSI